MKYICYSCMTETNNFYITKKGNFRSRFCKDCNKTFSAKERKKNVNKNVLQVITESKNLNIVDNE